MLTRYTTLQYLSLVGIAIVICFVAFANTPLWASQAENVAIYDDSLHAQNWSWGSTVADVDGALQVKINNPWSGLQLALKEPVSDVEKLSFDISRITGNTDKMQLAFLVKNGTKYDWTGQQTLALVEGRVEVTDGIPQQVAGVVIRDNGNVQLPSFTLDNIILERVGAAEPDPTTQPDPTADPGTTPETKILFWSNGRLLARNWSWGSTLSETASGLDVTINNKWAGVQLVSPVTITDPSAIVFTTAAADAKKVKVAFIVQNNDGGYAWKGGETITLESNKTFRIATDIPEQVAGIAFQDMGTAPVHMVFTELYFAGGSVPSTPTPPPASVPATPAPTPPPAETTLELSVDAGAVIGEFPTELLGIQAPQWMHDEFWKDKPLINDIAGLKQAYQAAGISLIRYGGGLEADDTGWERVPQESRDHVKNPETGKHELPIWSPQPQESGHYNAQFAGAVDPNNTYHFRYSPGVIDSIGQFSQATGIDVMLQINIEEYDPAMWADLLYYANVEKGYNFKYIEVGNEWDLKYARYKGHTDEESLRQLELLSASNYQARLESYVDALKAVDPDIQIIGGVAATAHNGNVNGNGIGGWSDYLIGAATAESPKGDRVDSLSYHWYSHCIRDTDPLVYQDMLQMYPAPDGQGLWPIQVTRSWAQYAPQEIFKTIVQPSNPALSLGITELNFEACDHYTTPYASNHMAAVWYADILGRLATNGLDYNIYYQGYSLAGENYSAIALTKSDAGVFTTFTRPVFYTMVMYDKYFGSQLVKATSTKEADVSLWAAKATDGSLRLMVTNMSGESVQKQIRITGKNVQSAELYQLTNPNPTSGDSNSKSQNHGTTLNGVSLNYKTIGQDIARVQPRSVDSVAADSVTVTLPAYSVSAILIE